MNLANKLTIFRMILVPIMVIIPFIAPLNDFSILGISLTWIIIELIFVIASITDKLDGYIARSRNEITTFGKFLDPIADKILVLAAMIMLVQDQRLPAWIPIIVLFREFIVSGYRLVAVGNNGNVIAASIWGKLKTVTQMLALVLAIVDMNAYGAFIFGGLNGFKLVLNATSTILMTISIIATIFSGWDYVKKGKDLFFNNGGKNEQHTSEK